MYLTDEIVTVVHFDRGAKAYICTVIGGVSWQTATRRLLQTTDAKEVTTTTVRIPEENMPDGLRIIPGDILCRGIVHSIDRRIDLEQYERFEVNEVRDNCRGSMLKHWAVIGA